MAVEGTSSPLKQPDACFTTICEDLIQPHSNILGNTGVKRHSQASTKPAIIPLTTSKLGNIAAPLATKKQKLVQIPSSPTQETVDETTNMDLLYGKLSEHQAKLMAQKANANGNGNGAARRADGNVPDQNSSRSSSEIPSCVATPSDNYVITPPLGNLSAASEYELLKKELAQAKNAVEALNQELSQTRITKHTVEQALGDQSEAAAPSDLPADVSEQTISKLQCAFNASSRSAPSSEYIRQSVWYTPTKADLERMNEPRAGQIPVNRHRGQQAVWSNGFRPSLNAQISAPAMVQQGSYGNWDYNQAHPSSGMAMGHGMAGGLGVAMNGGMNVGMGSGMNGGMGAGMNGGMGAGMNGGMGAGMNGGMGAGMGHQNFGPTQQSQRFENGNPAGLRVDTNIRGHGPYHQEPVAFPVGRSSNPPSRPGSGFGQRVYSGVVGPWVHPSAMARFPSSVSAMGAMPGPYQNSGTYQAQPIGTRLSPTAAEFSSGTGTTKPTPWNSESPSDQQTVQYLSPHEPINYRRLLDRNASCEWKLIVDKIVMHNDQQASIFLQQKLKIGTAEQKFDIVECIIAQAYPLMINRFGNFLIQRCFEHGTEEQVIAIANTIRGNTLTLSMDAFGCHVVQKAFDSVPEEYKAIMVHELLRRIPETVVHRYACHVWQKLFELRWSDSPPQIMKYVNEALRGMWHEVALGETGSLVVQNIFENCLEEDKRPCINEVLGSIDIVAHGQFGNWCIQHICEHGAPADRTRAIDHILRWATEYSMDQYASKVIEKCLKIGGTEFLDRYLDRVTEGRADRPRMPLVDIAGDQFGNYLVQHIMATCGPQHREIIAGHIRRHMVSLRGSKYGSRVAMLCCNPALVTRPGPPGPLQMGRHNSNGYGNRTAYGAGYHR